MADARPTTTSVHPGAEARPEDVHRLPRLDTMSLGARSRSTLRHAVWLGGLLVILGGLFGMHGLDAHGFDGMRPTTVASAAGPAAHAPVSTMHATTTPVLAAATVITAASHEAADTGMGMGALGMCMALVAVTLMSLISWLHTVRSTPLPWLAARYRATPRSRGRDPGPPSLVGLSIQRC